MLTQSSLFDDPSLYIVSSLKAAMNRAAKECGLSREQIVDRMNDLAERDGARLANGNARLLSLDIFEKWLNPQDTSRIIPLKAITYFCRAVGDHAPIDAIVRPLGLRVISQAEINQLEWAKASLKLKAARKRMRQLEETLDE